jgi:hypothetical protein
MAYFVTVTGPSGITEYVNMKVMPGTVDPETLVPCLSVQWAYMFECIEHMKRSIQWLKDENLFPDGFQLGLGKYEL